MKTNGFFFLAVLFLTMSSCQRDYACVCYNPGGSKVAFTINGTKSEAKQACQEYYEENFGAIVWNETYCEVD